MYNVFPYRTLLSGKCNVSLKKNAVLLRPNIQTRAVDQKKNNGRSKGPAVGGQVEEIEEPEGIFVRQGETR